MTEWKTAITEIAPNHIAPRGVPITELMENSTFGGVVYLLLTGKQPDEKVARLMDTILISSVDHGVTPPSALASRNAASTGAPLNACVASGILAINKFHGGAIEGCMRVLEQIVAHAEEKGATFDEAAAVILEQERAAKRRVPGYGHRVHTNDPRTGSLLKTIETLGLAGSGIQASSALGAAIEKQLGKKLPLNVDGAIAACLLDLGIDAALANAFFMIARVPGLVAHAREEATTQRPMRKIIQSEAVFEKKPAE
jgi:citrate synthase